MQLVTALVVAVVVASGCAPTLPFQMTETADVLARKQVSFTVAAGGGTGGEMGHYPQYFSGCCGGGDLRLSVGIGHDQEVGAEFALYGASGSAIYPAGKVRYKLGLKRHLAFVAGVGGAGAVSLSGGGSSPLYLGGDAALVASTDPLRGGAQVYGGVRATFSLPASAQFYQNAPTEAAAIPLGVALRTGPSSRLFIEGGMLIGASQFTEMQELHAAGWIGGYGALAVQWATAPPSTANTNKQ